MLESLALKALAVMPSYASPVQCNSPNMVERLRCLINSNKLQLPKHRWTANALQTTPKQSNARTASPPKYGRVRSAPEKRCQYLSNRRSCHLCRCYVGLCLGVRLIQFCLLSKASKKCNSPNMAFTGGAF